MKTFIVYDDPVRPENKTPTEEQKKKLKEYYERLVKNGYCSSIIAVGVNWKEIINK